MHDFDHKAHILGTIRKVSHDNDGALYVTTMVSDYADIEQDVKKWIPYIEIIEPKKFKEKLRDDLLAYLKKDA